MFFFYFNFFDTAVFVFFDDDHVPAGMFLIDDNHIAAVTFFDHHDGAGAMFLDHDDGGTPFDDDDIRVRTSSFDDNGPRPAFDHDRAGTMVDDDHLSAAPFMASGQGTQAQRHCDQQEVSNPFFRH
jgi:hypothetical protein